VEKALSQKVMCLCHKKPEQWTSLFYISVVESSSKFDLQNLHIIKNVDSVKLLPWTGFGPLQQGTP
jgi:hypothetical protein